eukprot:s236_g3.t1
MHQGIVALYRQADLQLASSSRGFFPLSDETLPRRRRTKPSNQVESRKVETCVATGGKDSQVHKPKEQSSAFEGLPSFSLVNFRKVSAGDKLACKPIRFVAMLPKITEPLLLAFEAIGRKPEAGQKKPLGCPTACRSGLLVFDSAVTEPD